jgi:hypothetical protein
LLKQSDVTTNDAFANDVVINDTNHPWSALLDRYGKFISGSSQIRLTQPDGSEIIGTVATHPTDPGLLIYNPFANTTPANTLNPINAVINPENVNIGSYLTNPATGTRYLIVNPIGNFNNAQGATAWQGTDGQDLVANANDIIQYNGQHWSVAFDSQTVNMLNYVTNLTTGIQYKWQNNTWTKSYDGVYQQGLWNLSI